MLYPLLCTERPKPTERTARSCPISPVSLSSPFVVLKPRASRSAERRSLSAESCLSFMRDIKLLLIVFGFMFKEMPARGPPKAGSCGAGTTTYLIYNKC